MRSREIHLFLAVALASGGWATSAKAQAAVEYGMAASHSATVTTKVATKLGSALNRVNSRTASKMENVRQSELTENRRRLEAKATQGGGTGATLHIESTPDKAVVFVDGQAVAYTPADLKLAPGTHQILLSLASFNPWKKGVTLKAGENPPLKAKLESEYQSQITVSIPK